MAWRAVPTYIGHRTLYLIPAWFYGHSILLIAPASEPRRTGLDKQGLKKQ